MIKAIICFVIFIGVVVFLSRIKSFIEKRFSKRIDTYKDNKKITLGEKI